MCQNLALKAHSGDMLINKESQRRIARSSSWAINYNDPDDDAGEYVVGDIYIMMKRLFVTKNEHFLKRPVCCCCCCCCF